MKFVKNLSIILFSLILNNGCSQDQTEIEYPKALVSINDYEILVKTVKEVRASRLISFNQLLKLQKDKSTVILDTRSRQKYQTKHIKGAINLPFTEFTTNNLRALIPDTNSQIIIYCNNNFIGDQINFASKTFDPKANGKKSMIRERRKAKQGKKVMLALNIPAYINLYGYGYRNIYELNELVNINDKRLQLEGNNGIMTLSQLSTARLKGNQ